MTKRRALNVVRAVRGGSVTHLTLDAGPRDGDYYPTYGADHQKVFCVHVVILLSLLYDELAWEQIQDGHRDPWWFGRDSEGRFVATADFGYRPHPELSVYPSHVANEYSWELVFARLSRTAAARARRLEVARARAAALAPRGVEVVPQVGWPKTAVPRAQDTTAEGASPEVSEPSPFLDGDPFIPAVVLGRRCLDEDHRETVEYLLSRMPRRDYDQLMRDAETYYGKGSAEWGAYLTVQRLRQKIQDHENGMSCDELADLLHRAYLTGREDGGE